MSPFTAACSIVTSLHRFPTSGPPACMKWPAATFIYQVPTLRIRHLFRRLDIIIFPPTARKPDHVNRHDRWPKNIWVTPSSVQQGEFWLSHNNLLTDSYLIIIRDYFLVLFFAICVLSFKAGSAKMQVTINKIFGNNYIDQNTSWQANRSSANR